MPPKKNTQKKKKLSNSNSQLTRTQKSGILKGVGKYSNGKKITRQVKGRGGFFEDLGGKAGQWLGSKAGGILSSVFGVGSYQVSKNSLTASASDPPQLTNTKGATRIQHREYIQDISGSTAFALQAFPINPGIAATFPWLASVANCFEEYVLHGLLFEFKSTSASALNSTNTALGTVIMATEYNALHDNFVAKRDMENYVYSTSCSPDVSALHPVECARDVNVLSELYVRNIPPSLPTDLRFSDLGRFQIATVGMQAAAVIGELWVTYDIELIKPKLPDAYTSIGPSHYVHSTFGPLPNPASAAPTTTNLFGISSEKVAVQGVGLSAVTLSTNTISFTTSGRYLILLMIGHTDQANMDLPSVTVSSSATLVSMFHTNPSGIVGGLPIPCDAGGETVLNCAHVAAIDVVAGGTVIPTLTYTAVVAALGISSLDLFIIPLPAGFQMNLIPDPISFIHREMEQMKLELEKIHLWKKSESANTPPYLAVEPGEPHHNGCVHLPTSTPGPVVHLTPPPPQNSFWRSGA